VLEWIARGLHTGVVTTRYPKRAESPPAGFRGRVDVLQSEGAAARLEALCPTEAIRVDDAGRVSLDRDHCILCGICVAADPQRFAFAPAYETAARRGDAPVALGERSRTLRRSIHIRHVDAGSDGGEEWEIQALTNPYYDIQRLGFFFTASPRHADILLVSGIVTAPMREPLRRAWETMPSPKAVVAVGTDATAGDLDSVLPVDVYVPGSPPSPIAILHGLLLATGALSE
jgi:Ni,Fe-hydrogenase III small subunit/ferredoxin